MTEFNGYYTEPLFPLYIVLNIYGCVNCFKIEFLDPITMTLKVVYFNINETENTELIRHVIIYFTDDEMETLWHDSVDISYDSWYE